MTRLSMPLAAAMIAALSAARVGAQPAMAGTDIIVTAVAHGIDRLDSSISTSVLGPEDMPAAAPRSVAELFRSLPGVRSESSGGEGNANIAVRGIPMSAGGAKFLQLQEDGLPVLEFGDIAFGNADIFLRADFNVARVESVRGGSASTFASNSPGGVINLLSRTGEEDGGAVQGTIGLDHGEHRIDADYGGGLGDKLLFHVGGFYRTGEGPRRAGYDGNRGGQIRANMTRHFPGGFVRLHLKHLDDRAIAYLPSPVRVTGTDASPVYRPLPGLSPNGDAIQSRHFTRAVTLDGDNQRAVDRVTDGMHPLVNAVGLETDVEIAAGWRLVDKVRLTDISGRFIAPFPAAASLAQTLATDIGGAGATAIFANGPRAGQAVPADAYAMNIVLLNTRLNSLDNLTNDLKLSRSIAFKGQGALEMTAGLYSARQHIDMDWTWSAYLLEAKGDNAALIDVRGANGEPVTDGGLFAHGAAFFGNCCRRSYALRFTTIAPYAALSYRRGLFALDASVRRDTGRARGSVAGDGAVTTFDVDGDGSIAAPERRATLIPDDARRPVDYAYRYWSWSIGANYRPRDDLALFARISRGGRANAERFVFAGNLDPATGALLPGARPVDFVLQAEGGAKYRGPALSLDGTAFWARTEEQNYEATTQRSLANTYRAYGLEIEGRYRRGGFTIDATGTWTAAKIIAARDPAIIGHRPRRQAEFIYRVTPAYAAGPFTIGASLIGTTASYTQDVNRLKLPGFAQLNGFVGVRPIDRLLVAISANNLFDVTGYTEAEEGAIPADGIVRARSVNGRTIRLSARVDL